MANVLTGMLPNISSAGMIKTVFIILVVLTVFIAVGIWLFFYLRNKKFKEFHVVIFERDSFGQTHERYDRAGIFLDKKTNLKLLFLKRLKKGLNPNEVPFVPSVDKKGRLIKTIYMVKIGVSNYKFCKVELNNNILKYTVGEEDVNWAAQDYETITKTFGSTSFMEKYGGYILFIITIIVVMVILVSLFGKFTILKEVTANLQNVAISMEKVATLLNQTAATQSGSPIIIGG